MDFLFLAVKRDEKKILNDGGVFKKKNAKKEKNKFSGVKFMGSSVVL